MTTHIQKELARCYAGLPPRFLELSEQEVDEMGARLDGRLFNVRPPLPTFPASEIEAEWGAIRKPRSIGTPKEL